MTGPELGACGENQSKASAVAVLDCSIWDVTQGGQEEGCCKGTWSKGDLRKEYAVWGRSVPEFQPGERSRGGASLAEFQRQPEASGSKAGHEVL